MYQAYGLLKADSDFSLGEAAKKLEARFPGFNIDQDDGEITVSKDDWEIHMTLNTAPEVLAESAKFAEDIEGAEHGGEMARCARRVEIASDIPDPEMDHFNDYLTMVEVMTSFKGVIGVDPSEPSLL